jgi:hypothetical protein
MTHDPTPRDPRTAEWLRGTARLGSGKEPRFGWLLAALVALISGDALIPGEFFSDLVFAAGVAVVTLATRPLLPPHGWVRHAQLGFGIAAVGLAWMPPTLAGQLLYAVGRVGLVCFFVSVAVWTVWHLVRARRVTAETLLGAVSGYLLLGIAFATVFGAVEVLIPGSLTLGPAVVAGEAAPDILYFSFITLTTIGYGDIVPVSEPARLLAMMEGVIGQFYIAAVVARLVALHIASPGEGPAAA